MGPMAMGGLTENAAYKSFEADADGTVGTTERGQGIAGLNGGHDAEGNGGPSPDEVAALFAQVAQGMAERPFTLLDADGNGEVSAEEMALPAQMRARMRLMHVNDAPAGAE